jgi:hypothetical protein
VKHRLLAAAALAVVSLTVVASASAFDCIRVSSSLQGLQASTKSGNWLLFDLSSPAAVQATAERVGEPMPLDVATCVADEYASYGVSPYFALGVGVAGGRTGHGTGVLAWNNPNDWVLGNGKGVDHLEDSVVGAALFGSLGACGAL